MKRIRNSLSFKILIYLIFFSIAILVILWHLQVVSLGKFYEISVKDDIESVISEIKEEYKSVDYEDYFNELSFKNNMCIEIYDGVTIMYSSISNIYLSVL